MCWGRLVRYVEVNGKYLRWTGGISHRKTKENHRLTKIRQETCFEKNHGEVYLVSSASSSVEELGPGLFPVSHYIYIYIYNNNNKIIKNLFFRALS
jgi:hypothetical protein